MHDVSYDAPTGKPGMGSGSAPARSNTIGGLVARLLLFKKKPKESSRPSKLKSIKGVDGPSLGTPKTECALDDSDFDDSNFDDIGASINKTKAARNKVAFMTARSDDGEGEEASMVDINTPLGLYSHGSSAAAIFDGVLSLSSAILTWVPP